jgi:transcriptional repressor NrdR
MEDKVIDSRESKEGNNIRRRRECLSCQKRFTTYERIEEIPFMVVKKDGRRERFDRQKILNGLLKACEKRPIPIPKLAELVDQVENEMMNEPERELSSTAIGEILISKLKELDKIAYVRFASVYRDFQDEEAFFNEIRRLIKDKGRG